MLNASKNLNYLLQKKKKLYSEVFEMNNKLTLIEDEDPEN